MLSNNNNHLIYSSSNNNNNEDNNNKNNSSNSSLNNSKRDLLIPLLSPEQLLFGAFEDCSTSELENGDILGDKELQFGIGSSSSLLLFSSPVVPFSIENDSSNINEIINESYNNNNNNNNNSKKEIKLNNDIGVFDSNNIFQLPQPQQQDSNFGITTSTLKSKSTNETSTTTTTTTTTTSNNPSPSPPSIICEPLPLYQPLPIPTPTILLSPDQEKIMTAKQVNKLIQDKQLLVNQNQLLLNDIYDNNQFTTHKDRKPRRPPEYPIHQVNLLMDEIDNILICKECDYKARTRKSVQSHIRRTHTDKLDKIREDCCEIFNARKDDYCKDSIVCDHYGCGAIIVKYNKSKHYRQPHHIGHPKEISECLRCKEVKQRTMMRNLKKEMKKDKFDQMEINC